MGTIGKIALIIAPWMLVIGLMGYLTHGQFFAPDGKTLIADLASFSGLEAIQNFRELSTGWGNRIETAFGQVTDLISFFTAIGTFFQTVGDVIHTFIIIMLVPFQIIGWLFANIFAPASIPQEEASSSSAILANLMC